MTADECATRVFGGGFTFANNHFEEPIQSCWKICLYRDNRIILQCPTLIESIKTCQIQVLPLCNLLVNSKCMIVSCPLCWHQIFWFSFCSAVTVAMYFECHSYNWIELSRNVRIKQVEYLSKKALYLTLKMVFLLFIFVMIKT